ncbi:hypothetical protein J5J83_07980 [Azoarcus sp. L1K30]|uniref:hypothetical protein n=1 Tax=Azoarcus sp. L1K30 TaxID=2820277 RepID=UPI001B83A26A|nr:hypothetical protein [Azoarcus sp. L1K30]MBR0566051.1 hypothetical protein [Azoarcus sp. L1K30]
MDIAPAQIACVHKQRWRQKANAGNGTPNIIVYDDALHTLARKVSFLNLDGMTDAAHIHCGTSTPKRTMN